jgi:hypothetical protein
VKDAAVVGHSESLLELSQGAWEGALRAECYSAAVLKEIESDPWNFSAPGGESQRAVEERMCDFIHTHVLPCAVRIKITLIIIIIIITIITIIKALVVHPIRFTHLRALCGESCIVVGCF